MSLLSEREQRELPMSAAVCFHGGMMMSRTTSLAGIIFLTVFVLFWSSLTSVFDYFALRNIAGQWRALDYPTTSGRILKSTVTRSRGSKGGTTYKPEISYEYEVGGRRFQSERYRYDWGGSSDSKWARDAVRSNPVGAERTVHYNARNPADAILVPGLSGSDIFLLMFLAPFNGVMLLMWSAVVLNILARFRPAEAGGVKLRHDRGRVVVRLPSLSPLAAALFAFCFGSFIGTFVVALTGGGFHPSLAKVLIVWGVIALVSLVVFAQRWRRRQTGVEDLVIDPGYATVTLPLTHGRKQREPISFPEVSAIQVKEHAQRGRRGGVTRSWQVWLSCHDGREERVQDFGDEPSARGFADWLRERVGLSGQTKSTL